MRSLARSSRAAARRSLGGLGALLAISLLPGWTGPAFAQSTQENTGANFTILDFPGAGDTTANGINNEGETVGRYVDAQGKSHGYLLSEDGFTTVDVPG